MKITHECEFGGRTIRLETGELAKQASGAVTLQFGETLLFVAAQTGPGRPGIDFFPLQVDYRERLAAAGRFAGGFLKREGRPTTREILTCRLTDRPIRPLFPKGFFDEVQVLANVLSCDGENDPSVLTMLGASAALSIAPVPFQGPIAGVRVGRIDGQFVSMPTVDDMKTSDLDLIVAGSADSVLMIEGFGQQIPEADMGDAIMFAHAEIKKLCAFQKEFLDKVNAEPFVFEKPPENPFVSILMERAYDKLREVKVSEVKAERHAAKDELKEALFAEFFPEGIEETEDGKTPAQFNEAFYQIEKKVVRDLILDGTRLDKRTPQDMRNVSCEVDVIPRVHGSAVFTRGETQSMATATLGSTRDQQRSDGLFGETSSRFMLHYYFPSFSVGEVRPIRGPGRREIGHGCLAERSVASVLPPEEKFPYTIRVISDILESNGSSSMASVCSATLALMSAGVPIIQPVAGISIGVVMESAEKYTLLTDIMGDEDHFGDMDFKVAGTQKGITGIQLDMKIAGISEEIIRATLDQALKARLELLRTMLTTIRRPHSDISSNAPRLTQLKIDPEKIGNVIGPGGKMIRAIQEETGATIDIDDEGVVTLTGPSGEAVNEAREKIEALTEDIEVGKIYNGTVSSVKEFGAFVEITPGKDGLCHISELSEGFVKSVTDICRVGDAMQVKVIAIDDQNRVKLSRKAIMETSADSDSDSNADSESYDD